MTYGSLQSFNAAWLLLLLLQLPGLSRLIGSPCSLNFGQHARNFRRLVCRAWSMYQGCGPRLDKGTVSQKTRELEAVWKQNWHQCTPQ